MKILITAGPTREPIDPVRFLTNRSSGKMGYAIAEAAREAGHEVVLVSGPVALAVPDGVKCRSVETAQQMFDAVREEIASCDVAIFSAAVADYRPKFVPAQKIKKQGETMTLELEKTQDILGSARSVFGFEGYLVGFAAETEKLIEHAQGKLWKKQCDLVVANDVSQQGIGFDSADNAVTLCFKHGTVERLDMTAKTLLAYRILERIESDCLRMR